jgi:hypothetical protein
MEPRTPACGYPRRAPAGLAGVGHQMLPVSTDLAPRRRGSPGSVRWPSSAMNVWRHTSPSSTRTGVIPARRQPREHGDYRGLPDNSCAAAAVWDRVR